jgi:NADPH2:quinone reductase
MDAMNEYGAAIARVLQASLAMRGAGGAERRARLKDFGADHAINTNDADWADKVLALTNGRGVELVIDQVSGGTINAAMRATAILGRIVNVGRLGGAHGDFDFDLHATRRIAYIGVTHRTRRVAEIREEERVAKRDLRKGVDEGVFRLPIDRVFALDEAVEALAHMKANAHLGKIILKT